MKHFALIFRTTRTLTSEELKQRAQDIAAWVKEAEAQGIALDPRNFGETLTNLSSEGNELISKDGPTAPPLSTVVFFDAPSKEDVVHLARIHPGLRYGVTVEVREWTSPRESAARQ